jgi:hypothetical protein
MPLSQEAFMHPHSERVACARQLRLAHEHLLEASERAHQLHLFELDSELLHIGCQLLNIAGELLELDSKRPTPPAKHERGDQLTFADAVLAYVCGDPDWERFIPQPATET